jgi:hypothetical protein
VTVYPLSLRGVTTEPEHLKDGTTRHTSVAVFGQGGGEPTDAGGSRDRVQAQSPDALGVVAVDGVTHRGPLLLRVFYRVAALSRGRRCASVPTVPGGGLLPTC